jgi:hypothetical protein
MSQAAHPTVIASNRVAEECPRRSSQAAPSGANMAGRSSRASGVVPPNQRIQPDAVPATRSVRLWQLYPQNRSPDLLVRRG